MHGAAWACLGAVKEKIHAGRMAVHESLAFERHTYRTEGSPIDKQIDVLRIPYSFDVNRRHPRRDCMATDHGIGNPGSSQRSISSKQSLLHPIHSGLHPLQEFKASEFGLANHGQL